MTLVEQIADQLGIDEEGARTALGTFAGQISHLVDTGGSLEVPGLGNFSEKEGVLLFKPTSELAEAVNHRFAGLETLTVTRSEGELTKIVKEEPEATLAPEDEAETEWAPAGPTADAVESDSVEIDSAESTHSRSDAPEDVFAESDPESANDEHKSLDSDEVLDDVVPEPELTEVESSLLTEETPESHSVSEPKAKPTVANDRSVRKPESRPASSSPARLFVPLLGVLAIVVALLWLVNRSGTDSGLLASEGSGSEQASSQGSAVENSTENPNGVDPASQTATQAAVPAPVPLWSPGQIERNVGAYTIIVSSEETRPEAEAIARSIATRLNQITDVFVSTVNNTTRYRVGVGQYSSSTSAASELSQMTTELPDGSWVLRIQPSM